MSEGGVFFCKKILRLCYTKCIYDFFFILKTNLSVSVYIYLDKIVGYCDIMVLIH